MSIFILAFRLQKYSHYHHYRLIFLFFQVLEADLAILDEIDSGLDVDALQDVAKAVNGLLTPNNSVLIITHYQRLLECIKPSYVHIMVGASYLIRITVKELLICSLYLFFQ